MTAGGGSVTWCRAGCRTSIISRRQRPIPEEEQAMHDDGVARRWYRRRRRRRGPAWAAHASLVVAALCPWAAAENAAYSLDLTGITSGTAYTLSVEIGTSAEATTLFRLIADTGSSNDAVLGAGCCGDDAQVTYSCDVSSTCNAGTETVSLEFAGAKIAGHFVSDKWSSAEFGSLTKDFLVIDEQDTFYRNEYDGITGLAYSLLKQPKDAPKASFYENLVQSKPDTKDAFGLLLCGIMQPLLTSANFSLHAGQMLVGGTEGVAGETFFTGPLLYSPIAQEAWFVVIVSDVGFDGKSLGLPCAEYNEPQAIIDSGTSNIAFPSDVYNALMDRIREATKAAVPDFEDTYFDYRKSCCGKDYCSPQDAQIALLSLPFIYITFALQEDDTSDTTRHYTVEIPPEYYFRPEMNGKNSDVPCRAIGLAEGSSIVLGDVLMDGLFAYHDRVDGKLGLALADNCPNGVKSTKKIYIAESKNDNWCDCFSDKLKAKSPLASYFPWGKTCFFMPWWMYMVLASALIVIICVGVLGYWYWTGRRDKLNNPRPTRAARTPALTPVVGGPDSVYANYGKREPPPPGRRAGDVASGYSIMSSPREMADSNASSIALLTSGDDPLGRTSDRRDAARPAPTSSHWQDTQYYQQQQQPSRQHHHNQQQQPPRQQRTHSRQHDANRETSGFLL